MLFRSLLQLIKNEAREIFIETPYAQFSPELRSAIEKALQRGVRVSLITNSLFISDGLSKIIRVLMARWMERTKEQYPDLFQVRYVTLAGGRMTHFKGAAFGCQKGKNGNFQVFIIGSHNFDPRSGRSDKDHALRWEENWSNCESLLNSRLVSGRMALYASLANGRHTFTLAEYPDILKELEEVVNRENSEKDDLRRLATSLKKVFYEYTPSGYRINQAEKVKRLLKLMEEGGLGDLLGQLF